MRKTWVLVVMLVALAGAAPVAAQPPQPSPNTAALAVTEQDRVLGKPEAPITIIEYASLTCPHCAHFEADVLPKLKEKWLDSGKAKLVLRDFPLDEPALRAAMIARCAPPSRFYPLVDTFFATQEKWVIAKDWRGALEKLAKLGGVSNKDFTACLANKQIEDEVVQSRLIAAQQLEVDSTPTFFINGTKFAGAPTFEAFDQELSKAAPKS